MTKKIVFAFPGNEALAEDITIGIKGEKGNFVLRKFPDEETFIRVLSDVTGRDTIIVCTLAHPDDKILSLYFLCSLLKDMKARSVCLVAPYLAYMRQDKQFNTGEAITSEYFAKLLSSFLNKLITIDPHLHRRTSLKEIYSIPCEVLHASEIISEWIKINVPKAILIGPDSESEQWVSQVALNANVPFTILKKNRMDDTNVIVSIPRIEKYKGYTPVLVDDIISTAKTMIETIKHLKQLQMKSPVCIGIHGIFAPNAYENLLNAGAGQVITSNTILHKSNNINISSLLTNILTNESML